MPTDFCKITQKPWFGLEVSSSSTVKVVAMIWQRFLSYYHQWKLNPAAGVWSCKLSCKLLFTTLQHHFVITKCLVQIKCHHFLAIISTCKVFNNYEPPYRRVLNDHLGLQAVGHFTFSICLIFKWWFLFKENVSFHILVLRFSNIAFNNFQDHPRKKKIATCKRLKPLVDPRGRWKHATPSWSNFFQFHAVLEENGQNNKLTHTVWHWNFPYLGYPGSAIGNHRESKYFPDLGWIYTNVCG